MTDADSATLQEALALNAQLKEMETLMSRVEASKARLGSSSAARSGIGGYGGRTFTSAQEYEIQRNNAHLINKLARVRVEANAASGGRPPVLSREGSAAINRKKKASEIERENAVRARVPRRSDRGWREGEGRRAPRRARARAACDAHAAEHGLAPSLPRSGLSLAFRDRSPRCRT